MELCLFVDKAVLPTVPSERVTVAAASDESHGEQFEGRSKEEKILRMIQTVRTMHKSIQVSDEQLRAVVEEAYRTTDLEFGVEAAVTWGAGFQWPADVTARDEVRAAKHNFNLSDMADEVHAEMLPDRLSNERIDQWVAETDLDIMRLAS